MSTIKNLCCCLLASCAVKTAVANTTFYGSIAPMYVMLQGSSLGQAVDLTSEYSPNPINTRQYHKDTPAIAIAAGLQNNFNQFFLRTTAEFMSIQQSNMSYTPLYLDDPNLANTSATFSIQPNILLAKEYLGFKLKRNTSVAFDVGVGEGWIRNTFSTSNIQPAFVEPKVTTTNHNLVYALGGELSARMTNQNNFFVGYEHLLLGKVKSNTLTDTGGGVTHFSIRNLTANAIYAGVAFA